MKRVAALVLIALFVTAAMAKPARAEGLLSDFFSMLKKWFESSPLGNLFSMPVKRMEAIELTFYPDVFELVAEEFVNVSTESSEIENFRGVLSLDTGTKTLTMKESGTPLFIKQSTGTINVYGLKLASMELRNMKLVLTSGNWNETTENGSLVIKDFLGNALIKEGMIKLVGNVSRVIKE